MHYVIDGFHIKLSEKHMLPIYQEAFCYYDKVLPAISSLADKESSGSWVIDIGANIGDTVCSMLKHTSANFLCIEPDADFYRLLKQNVSTLDEQYRHRITCLNAFVVLNTDEQIALEKKLGTAHKVLADNADSDVSKSFKLEEIIQVHNIKPQDINLIKVDTDGFDWECLLSLGDLIYDTDAFLYWENQIDRDNTLQSKGYLQLAHYLNKAGYQHFFCFDNFGNFLAHGNVDFLIDINNYLCRLNEKKTERTFYYVDVLACKEFDIDRVKQMINKFYQ